MGRRLFGFAKSKRLIACLLLAVACPISLLPEEVVITVRLINGKNGKPVTDENLNIFRIGSGFAEGAHADRNGLIQLRIDRDAVVGFGGNIDVTCHPYSKQETQLRRYKVIEILEHGMSDENMCSKKIRVTAKPGEFVFFERPRTFWEWMAL
jgi:hypothetical protein